MPECVECGSEAEAHPHPLCAPCLESLIRYDLVYRMGRERSLGVFYFMEEERRGARAPHRRAIDRCYRQYPTWRW